MKQLIRISLAITVILILVLVGCGTPGDPILDDLYTRSIYPGTANTYDIGSEDYPYREAWFDHVFVGSPTTLSVAGNRYGGIIASDAIRSEASVSAVAYNDGTGLWVSAYGTLAPQHIATGSYSLTLGGYENVFTSTTPIFSIDDMEYQNFIVILSEDNYGQAAQITTYIDAFNVVVRPSGWDSSFSGVEFVIFLHPMFYVGDGGRISMYVNSSGNVEVDSKDYTNGTLFSVALDSADDDMRGVLVDVDANGFTDIEAIEIQYNTSTIQPGDLASIIKIDMDETDAVTSNSTTEIDFINLLTTDSNDLLKHGIHIGQSFDSALTVSGGVEEDPDYGYEVTPDVPVDRVNGIAPDGTAFLEASASDLIIFDADNDYILIGSDATFEAIDAILVSGANQPILEEYYYSTGAGTWDVLITSNTVDGFTQSGTITFNAPAAWAKSNLTVPAGAAITNAFYVKIVRTRNFLGAPPVEDYFTTFTSTSLTDFEIRGDGTIRPVEIADVAAPNNSLYYSITQSKLVYKDSGGVVRDLW